MMTRARPGGEAKVAQRSFFIPPRPLYSDPELSSFRLLTASRTNPLVIWPDEAYERDRFARRSLGRIWFLLNHPNEINHVLVENSATYRRTSAGVRIFRPLVGRGLLLSKGNDWKHQRRTIAPAFAPRMMPLLARHMVDAVQELVASLSSSLDNPVDLLGVMYNVSLKIAGQSMFSLQMQQFGSAIREMLDKYREDLARPSFFDLVVPAGIPTFRDLRRRRFSSKWVQLFDRIIDARAAAPSNSEPPDLFDLLRRAKDPETGKSFDRSELRDEVATMISTGHETTALLLFWALYLLASAPDEQEILAAELKDRNFCSENISDSLSQLPRARAVIAETLRLYPPIFMLVRQAIEKDQVGDVAIPRGSVVTVAPWVLHRHRRLWRDPDAFDPSRFLPDAPSPPRYAYLPFGAGPRVCVGALFAITQATVVLATLMQAFRLEVADHKPVLPKPVITTVPDRAPLFWIRPR
jgi:cytochrome P450